jgi:hypothetical protein
VRGVPSLFARWPGRGSSALAFCVLLGSLALGCDDLKDFRGEHTGRIVEGNFVRGCFTNSTELTLQFDPDYARKLPDGGTRLPNTIHTSDGTFQNTPLEAIPYLPNDPLSELDFPGPQRLRNYLMMARPEAGPLAGRDAFVVISLLASKDVEVRIIARSANDVTSCPSDLEARDAEVPDEDDVPIVTPSTRREYFGLWRLK